MPLEDRCVLCQKVHLINHACIGRIGRIEFDSGMRRDSAESKIRWDLVFDGPMLRRLAEHLTKGAAHYGARNWMLANGPEEKERFRQSAARHFCQWMNGEKDEAHDAAVIFNLMGFMLVEEREAKANAESRTCG